MAGQHSKGTGKKSGSASDLTTRNGLILTIKSVTEPTRGETSPT
jgi:hypothetical protein